MFARVARTTAKMAALENKLSRLELVEERSTRAVEVLENLIESEQDTLHHYIAVLQLEGEEQQDCMSTCFRCPFLFSLRICCRSLQGSGGSKHGTSH